MRQLLCALVLLMASPQLASGESAMADDNAGFLAGDHVGNGGKVIVCTTSSGKVTSIELLDFYEGRVSGEALRLDTGDFRQRAVAMVAQLTPFDPQRAARYESWLASFDYDAVLLDARLTATDDASPIITPPAGCSLQQAATQLEPLFPGIKRYNISAPLWNLMDDTQRAGLLVHELVYREGIRRGYLSSEGVRYFTRLLGSGALASWDPERYTSLLRAMKFADAVWDDPVGKKRWTLLGTPGVLHKDVDPACIELAAAVMPSAEDMQAVQQRLATSPLYPLLAALEDPETWTATRRPSDGYDAVADWGAQTVAYVYRPATDRKNILCVRPGPFNSPSEK